MFKHLAKTHPVLSLSVLLFAFNLFTCWRVVRFDYTNHMGSIEGAYVAISKHYLESWPDLAWWPAWYNGIPTYYSYPPLLHALVAVYAKLSNISVIKAHHIVTALFYALGPVTVFWLVKRLSGSVLTGFCSGLVYSIISPTAFFLQDVLRDLETPLIIRRLHTLIAYGDGPHVAALALVPLALLLIDYAVVETTPVAYLLAAISVAAVTLTNWLGAAALLLFVLAYLLAYTDGSLRHVARLWLTALGIGLLAYLLSCPLLPPSLIQTVGFNAQTIGGDYRLAAHNLLVRLPYILATLGFAKALAQSLKVARHVQVFFFFALESGGIAMSMSAFKLPLVPQPERYSLEFDLALVPLLVCIFLPHLRSLSTRWTWTLALILCLASGVQTARNRQFARDSIKPIPVEETVEYRTARWFDEHLGGSRAMAMGSVEFWLNAFTAAPQQGGGFEQGNPNWQNRVSQFIISSGIGAGENGPDVTLTWLKAFGIRAIAVGGPASRDSYRPFQQVERFAHIGEKVWSDQDDCIYLIPLRNASLAHVMRRQDLVSRPPINGIDVAELKKYVAAVDDESFGEATFGWTSRHSAVIDTVLRPGELVATQISYFPGWKAFVGGTRRQTFRDELGFLVIEPACSGICSINLSYDARSDDVAVAIAVFALVAMVGWTLFNLYRQDAKTGSTRRTTLTNLS